MKSAIIMINNSELDSETLSKIGADFFYCLFDKESPYSTDIVWLVRITKFFTYSNI